MRWVLPAAVVVSALGVLLLYVPLGNAAASTISPGALFVLLPVGMIGIAVGVIGAWRNRAQEVGAIAASHRVADATALAGLVVAVAALLAVSSVYVVEPIIASLQGPDPCAGRFDTACFAAHPDYWQHDPSADSWVPAPARLSETVLPVAWPAGLGLSLAAALLGWLALAYGTRRRRIALSALTLGSIVFVFMVVPSFGFLLGGGD